MSVRGLGILGFRLYSVRGLGFLGLRLSGLGFRNGLAKELEKLKEILPRGKDLINPLVPKCYAHFRCLARSADHVQGVSSCNVRQTLI